MNDNIELLTSHDVISLEDEKTKIRMSHKTFTSEEFLLKIQEALGLNQEGKEWFKQGVLANVLVAGKFWRKGKVKITIQFISDENSQEKSILDDFRKPQNKE